MRTTRRFLLSCLWYFSSNFGLAFGQIYTVHGTLQYEVLVQRRYEERYTFALSYSNCTWAIEMVPSKDAAEDYAKATYYRWVYDGATATCLTVLRTPAGGANGTVFVDSDEIPSSAPGGWGAQLWLAYASQCYFNRLTNRYVRPITPIDLSRRKAQFTTYAEWQQDVGKGPPKSIRYYLDQNQWALFKSSNNSSPTNRVQTLPLWASYDSDGSVSASDVQLPKSFTFVMHSPNHEVTKMKRLSLWRVSGTVTSVSHALLPRLFDRVFPGVASVDDIRFSTTNSQSGITYIITNSEVPSLASPRLGLLTHQQRFIDGLTAKANNKPIKRSTPFITVAAIVTAVFGVLLYIKTKVLNRKENK